jgi:outer membrane protein TolC
MRKRYYVLGFFVTLWFQTTAAFGQPPGDERVRLSLSQAIQLALANNKDIELARQDVQAAEWDFKSTLAHYEPRSTVSSFYERTRTPVASFLSGGVDGLLKQSELSAGYRLEGSAARGGGNYEVNLSFLRRSTNNIFAALNPHYPAELTFRYLQPLGRGRSFSTRNKDIEIAKKNTVLTQAQLRQSATETIVEVQRAYWDLVFARQRVTIQNEMLRDLAQRLEVDQRRVSTGTLAAIEIAPISARIAQSQEAIYDAVEEVTRAENALKYLIAENNKASLWTASIIPLDNLDSDVPAVTMEAALGDAMANRIELEETDIVREIRAVEERYYRDQTRPRIDVLTSYGITGMAGTSVDSPAVDRLIGPTPGLPGFMRGNNVRVGIEIQLPFRNREAEAKLGRAIVERERVATQQEKLKQLVTMDVRNAVQAVHLADSKQRAAAVARVSLEDQFASEQRKLNVGYSTTNAVLERRISLAMARVHELRAQLDRNKALAELQRATGTALQTNNVVVR